MKNIILFLLVCVPSFAYSQRVLELVPNYFAEEGDSGKVFVLFSTSYLLPVVEEENQVLKYTKVATPQRRIVEGQRLFSAEMEILTLPCYRYQNRFQPHAFFRAQAFLSNYVSSMVGVGISDKKLSTSLGVFAGSYFRRSPGEGNFISKVGRFEYAPLVGFYIQTKSEYASFMFSYAKEEDEALKYARMSGKVGNMCRLLKGSRVTKSSELVVTFQNFTGLTAGLSFEPVSRLRLDTSWIIPEQREIYNQARIDEKLSKGFLISLSYYVE